MKVGLSPDILAKTSVRYSVHRIANSRKQSTLHLAEDRIAILSPAVLPYLLTATLGLRRLLSWYIHIVRLRRSFFFTPSEVASSERASGRIFLMLYEFVNRDDEKADTNEI